MLSCTGEKHEEEKYLEDKGRKLEVLKKIEHPDGDEPFELAAVGIGEIDIYWYLQIEIGCFSR